MSGKLVGRIYDEIEIKRPMQIVLVAMADHAHDDGSKVFPSLDRIAWKTGYSVRQVQRIIGALKEMGVLKVVREGAKGRSTEYRIVLSKAPKKKPFNVWKAEQAKYPDKMSDALDDILSDDDKMSLDSTDGSGDTGVANGVTSGCPPNRPVTASDSSISPDGEMGETPVSPLDEKKQREREINETAKGIVMAYCEASGVSHDAIDWAVEMKAAKSLARKHLTPERVKPFYVWLASQTWVTSGVTLRLMNSQSTAYLEYRRRQEKPVRNIV